MKYFLLLKRNPPLGWVRYWLLDNLTYLLRQDKRPNLAIDSLLTLLGIVMDKLVLR